MGKDGDAGQQQVKGRGGREKVMLVVLLIVAVVACVYYFALKGNPTASKAVDTVKQGTHDAAVQVEKATEPARPTPPKR